MATIQIRKREPGVIRKTWNRTGSVLDNGLGIADNVFQAGNTVTGALNPMAEEITLNSQADLEDAKLQLLDRKVNLALAKKQFISELSQQGFTNAEIKDILK